MKTSVRRKGVMVARIYKLNMVSMALAWFVSACALFSAGVWWNSSRGNGIFRFSGRVVDGSGLPVPGVLVSTRVDATPFFSFGSPYSSGDAVFFDSATTDNNGNFHFLGNGRALQLTDFRYTGWALINGGIGQKTSFNCVGSPLPDSQHPAIFRMAWNGGLKTK